MVYETKTENNTRCNTVNNHDYTITYKEYGLVCDYLLQIYAVSRHYCCNIQ